MISNRPPQHRITFFNRVENRSDRYRFSHLDLHLALNPRQIAQVIWQRHSDHDNVCTSTEYTAGKSRTIGFHVSPLSADP